MNSNLQELYNLNHITDAQKKEIQLCYQCMFSRQHDAIDNLIMDKIRNLYPNGEPVKHTMLDGKILQEMDNRIGYLVCFGALFHVKYKDYLFNPRYANECVNIFMEIYNHWRNALASFDPNIRITPKNYLGCKYANLYEYASYYIFKRQGEIKSKCVLVPKSDLKYNDMARGSSVRSYMKEYENKYGVVPDDSVLFEQFQDSYITTDGDEVIFNDDELFADIQRGEDFYEEQQKHSTSLDDMTEAETYGFSVAPSYTYTPEQAAIDKEDEECLCRRLDKLFGDNMLFCCIWNYIKMSVLENGNLALIKPEDIIAHCRDKHGDRWKPATIRKGYAQFKQVFAKNLSTDFLR